MSLPTHHLFRSTRIDSLSLESGPIDKSTCAEGFSESFLFVLNRFVSHLRLFVFKGNGLVNQHQLESNYLNTL